MTFEHSENALICALWFENVNYRMLISIFEGDRSITSNILVLNFQRFFATLSSRVLFIDNFEQLCFIADIVIIA